MNSLPAALESSSSLDEARRPQLLLGKDAQGLERVREFARKISDKIQFLWWHAHRRL